MSESIPKEIVASSWDDLIAATHRLREPIFRGQASFSWGLDPSLERLARRLGLQARARKPLEGKIQREFKRRYHHYNADGPSEADFLEWAALMQHHGAPTRLLDWTYSRYVALYFAIESTQDDAALWCIDDLWLRHTASKILERESRPVRWLYQPKHDELITSFEAAFLAPVEPTPLVAPVNPFRLNERLTVQRGLFLCPSNLDYDLEDSLFEMEGAHDNILKVLVPVRLRVAFLRRLDEMNISRATLFPGLDGFASSLSIFHHAFVPFQRDYSDD